MVETTLTRKKAQLSPKLLQAHLSNVKESLYLFDHTKVVGTAQRNFLINYQLETLLQSKLYGPVILFSFRSYERDVRYISQDLQTKFSKGNLAKNLLTIEVEGAPMAPGLPGRKERVKVCHCDNLIMLNLSPCLSRSDATSIYDLVRSAKNPYQSLMSIIQAIIKQLSLT